MQMFYALMLISLAGLFGCSTTASKERLEKQNRLLEIELENKDHALESAKLEIEQLKAQVQQSDDRLKDVTVAGEDKSRTLDEIKKKMSLDLTKLTQCQTLLEQVRDHLATGKFNSRAGRQQFLQTLSDWQSQPKAESATH